jgi:FkbH-like protein
VSAFWRTVSLDAPYLDQLKAAREASASGLDGAPLRLMLVAAAQLDTFAPILSLWLRRAGFAPVVEVAPYDTIEQQVMAPESELYRFRPDIVVLAPTAAGLLQRMARATDRAGARANAQAVADHYNTLATHIRQQLPTDVVIVLPAPDAARPLGNRDGIDPAGALYRSRLVNQALADLELAGVTTFDLCAVAERHGLDTFVEPRLWYHAKQPIAPPAFGPVAHALTQLVAGMRGRAYKALVLDLDNTLWGGVIGDDGVDGIALGPNGGPDGEAFREIQSYARALRETGILLAVCSKNDMEVARKPFVEHPDMVLRLDDISVFVANWKPKPENLRQIARDLNIELNALVFLEDDPVERDFVRRTLPEVCVPELPVEPAEVLAALDRLLLFDRPRLTAEDLARSGLIAAESKRRELQAGAVDLAAYLASLGLVAVCGNADAASLPRVTQLINKTNQFNLTGERVTSSAIESYMASGFARWYRLSDRLGDYGIVSAVVGRIEGDRLLVDNWVVSCRAFQRSLEAFILNDLVRIASSRGCGSLAVRLFDTGRNAYTRNAVRELGFNVISDGLAARPVPEAPLITYVASEDAQAPRQHERIEA